MTARRRPARFGWPQRPGDDVFARTAVGVVQGSGRGRFVEWARSGRTAGTERNPLRPAPFARYLAASAAPNTSTRVCPWIGLMAMPMATVRWRVSSALLTPEGMAVSAIRRGSVRRSPPRARWSSVKGAQRHPRRRASRPDHPRGLRFFNISVTSFSHRSPSLCPNRSWMGVRCSGPTMSRLVLALACRARIQLVAGGCLPARPTGSGLQGVHGR